jgi:hypothetical protein
MSEGELNNVLDYTIKELLKVAKENGVITVHEFKMLKRVRYDVREYQDALKKALDDNVITPEENKELTKLKDDILNNVVTVANMDKIVDDEETDIIQKLTEIVNEYFVKLEDKGSGKEPT